MDIYKHKLTQLQEEIFSLLCLYAGEKMSQREISKKIGVSPTAISNSLNLLVEEKLIKVEKMKTINFVSFNRDEEKSISLKRVENIKNIYNSQILDYMEKELPGGTVILFGSYSRGEDTDSSDIDIAVIGRKDKILNLDKFEKILNRKININFYDSWKKIDIHLKNNILNGIVFTGGVEL